MASPSSNSTSPPSDDSAPQPKDSPSPPSSDASTPPPKSSPPPSTKSPPPSPPNASPPPASSSSPPSPPPADNNSPPSVVSSPPLPSQSTSPILPSNPGVLPPPAPKEGTIKSPPGKESSNDGSSSQSTPAIPNDDISIDRPVVIGVVAGVGLFFILILACALVCLCKRKKNKRPGHYDAEGGKDYYKNKGSAPPEWQPRGKNHKIPPPPGLVPPPGGAGWQHHGALTPSEETGSSNYSPSGANSLPPPSPSLGFNKSAFTYEELAAASGGFSQSNILGQGGFGYVYKGILPYGKEVAIKQLKAGSGQGEREFHAEVEIISRVHHRHLVSLVGYCIAGAQRLLVYDFVPNNTLEYHLHGEGVPTMDWPTRLKIAIGSAKGLAYLHEDCHPRIIHRDIKTANILLDYKFEAMVADFGLAKLSPDTHTHVSTRIMGTFGYLAPEYASSGKLTDKSDVFSYGVVLLELITGRKPVDHTNRMDEGLVEWARPRLAQILAEENYNDLVDPKLEGNYSKIELNRMITCAAASVRHSGKKRPRMSQIIRALEGDMVSFDDISSAARAGQSSTFSSSGSEAEARTYSSKMREFNKLALASEVYTGEYSGISVTSEYGLNPSDSSSSSSGESHPDATLKPH